MPGSLIDSSAWIAAVFPSHPFHESAQAVLQTATASAPAVFCRATQVSFLRLATTPPLLRQYDAEHMTNRAALAELQMLLSRPEISEIDEPPAIAVLWHLLAECDSASPKVWMDAYLAAFAITAGLTLVTFDRGFKNYVEHDLDLYLLPS